MSRIVLVGCVSQKLPCAAAAADFYTSPLFRKRRAYAEAAGCPWFILSAFYGLVSPDHRLWPYEQRLRPPLVAEWSGKLARQLKRARLDGVVLEVHAGVHYVDGVERAVRRLEREGVTLGVETPLKGLAIGKQLQWYTRTQLQLPEAA